AGRGGLGVGRPEPGGRREGGAGRAPGGATRALGAGAGRTGDRRWRVDGVGLGGLAEPADMIDLGNSGTAARLLLGILATHPFTSFVTGDASLRSRPMRRVIDPLSQFGARFMTREGGRLPLALTGAADPVPQTPAAGRARGRGTSGPRAPRPTPRGGRPPSARRSRRATIPSACSAFAARRWGPSRARRAPATSQSKATPS